MLENLRKRYEKDQIYTYAAHVLLAVNPYKAMDSLYTEDLKAYYRGKGGARATALTPHPYASAETAFQQLGAATRAGRWRHAGGFVRGAAPAAV